MPPWARAVCVAVALVAAGQAQAITRFHVESDAGDPIGRGDSGTFSSPDAAFSGFVGGNYDNAYAGVGITKYTSPSLIETSWQVSFGGTPLAPGSYDVHWTHSGEPSSLPGIFIEVLHNSTIPNSAQCPSATGHLTIHAIEFAYAGHGLRTLVADFELRCAGRAAAVRGSIDFWAGDRDCDGAPEGAACDDRNPCTTDDRCVAGSCEATASLVCQDDAVDTDDVCVRHLGCRFPSATGFWATKGRATVTASGPGGTATRRTRSEGLLVLGADGTWRGPFGAVPCVGIDPVEPIVLAGQWRSARRRLSLTPDNAREFVDAIVECDGSITRARVVGYHHTVRAGRACGKRAERRLVCGREQLRLQLRVRGQTVRLSINEAYRGTRLDDGEWMPLPH